MGSARSKEPHLLFSILDQKPKTIVEGVRNRETGEFLGEIAWWGAFRSYAFMPSGDTIWSVSCLKEVETEIARLMAERKQAREGTC